MKRLLAAAFLASLFAPDSSRADSVLIGNFPSAELALPFGLGSDGGANPSDRFQQVYNSSFFGGSPIVISQITFFAQGTGAGGLINPVTYNLDLSTTSKAVGGLDPTNFNANVGADNALFASINPTGNVPATFNITGTSPFLYDPTKGNLLLDIQIPNQVVSGTIGALLDGFAGGFGKSSSVAQNFDNTLPADSGLTTLITFTVVPELDAGTTGQVLACLVTGLAFMRRRRIARAGRD